MSLCYKLNKKKTHLIRNQKDLSKLFIVDTALKKKHETFANYNG